MAQVLRPAADRSLGPWLPNSAGSPTELWPQLDETSPADADYIYTESAGVAKVRLAPGTDPSSSSGHVVRYRATGDGATDLVVSLYDVSTSPETLIATWTEEAASTTAIQYEHTLSSGEADAITDYSALELWFEAAAAGGSSFTDTFNRTNGNLDGSTSSDSNFTWSETLGTIFEVVSNACHGIDLADGTFYVAATSADVSTDNYFVEFVITGYTRDTGTTLNLGMTARGSTYSGSGAGADGYGLEAGILGDNTLFSRIYRYDTDADLDTDTTVDISGGGTLRFEVNGTSLTAKWNGTPFMSATDSTFSGGSGSRKAGITAYAANISINDFIIDDFAYGDL